MWTATAERALARLPEKVAAAAVEFIYGSLDPRVGKPLRFELEGLRSARRGDYRVVYEVDLEQAMVTIIAIQHRSDVYRQR
ncbi:MAG: type II toxin-antitoxin system RelE/ParE family toxin [Micrococcales bacterium]|nr:type II toxin-antitoxin system RelE/ParE family toxin [Micrococcales bacterium]